jgi:short-subunit dehydrogenase
MNTFPYHTALVTGASSGLGAAIAGRLVLKGCTVWATSRDSARISVEGVEALSVDLADARNIAAFCEQMQQELEQVDLLVNNAGYGVFGDIETHSPADIHDQLELMLTAPALLCAKVLPGMKMRRHGCIVNVSSLAAQFPIPGMSIYNAAKSGISTLSHCIAAEARGHGVHVIDLQPGDFRSGFLDATRNTGSDSGAWRKMSARMRAAPDAVTVADKLIEAIEKGRSGIVRAGSFVQATLGPLGAAILPRPAMKLIERLYME